MQSGAFQLGCCSILLVAILFSASALAQETATSGNGAAYVPTFSFLSLRVNARQLLRSPMLEMVPIEVAQAWSVENLGLDLDSVSEIKLVAGMPMGPGMPPVGAVLHLSKDFDPANINADLLGNPAILQVDGHEAYVFGSGLETLLLHLVDARTAVVANVSMLQPMLAAAHGDGPLAERIKSNPMGDATVQLIAAVEPVRPLLSGAAQQFGGQLPPPIQDLAKVPELLDAVVLTANVADGGEFNIEMLTAAPAKATELLEILSRSITFGKELAIAQSENEIQGDGPVVEAQRAYAKRISEHVAQLLLPEQKQDRLVIEGKAGVSVATSGVLVALLLPAVQAAREAARRTSAANNLKQIGLALHNYHDVYKKFPDPAILDEEGKPLLSWRVAILPFLDQAPLYEQFHLDEPWDSPHNIKLSRIVLPVYTDPSALTQPGETVFQAAVGDELAFKADGNNRVHDMLDGTSNTIMVVETAASEAVVWSAPKDVEIDLNQPLAKMGNAHAGGFQVLFGDGAVRFISQNIDVGMLRALLTRAGGEQVGGF